MNDVESFFPFVLVVITTVTATAAAAAHTDQKKSQIKAAIVSPKCKKPNREKSLSHETQNKKFSTYLYV